MTQPALKKRKTDDAAESTISDPRFANIQSDPRYRLPGKKQKVKLDNRFSRALADDDFSRRAEVDRYGRPLDTDSEKKRLKRRYEFEDDASEESDNADEDDEVQRELARVNESRDILRQGRDVASSDEESSSEEDSDTEYDLLEDEAGPGLQKSDVPVGEVSSRLAVVNLDWDNIRAEDLMAVFGSFLPSTSRLLKVAIYPSEFGKERMEREEMEGPPKEIFANAGDEGVFESEDDEEDLKEDLVKPDDGSEFDSSALRKYQLDRLRYYYAVLTFSSTDAARVVYEQVDGTEYLSTANFFDLRFVPNGVSFEADHPREECERIPPGYKPNDFATDALQHSKVKLTWDAEDGGRKEAQARAFRGSRKEIDENDLKAYLGSDSGESDEVMPEVQEKGPEKASKKDAERQRMRALLGLPSEPTKKTAKAKDVPSGNIQITFSSGLAGAADEQVSSSDEHTTKKSKKGKRSVFANSPEPEETTIEKYIRKEKERKQRRKEKMKNPTTAEPTDITDSQIQNQDPSTTDTGFDDPFFNDDDTPDVKSASKLRKEDRLQKRREREAEEAASAKSRKELELLMADDANTLANPSNPTTGSRGRTVKHFDMNEIEKAEKRARKKKNKNNKNDKNKTAATDDFNIDTADPRFSRLFENHEFAIDPSNPRFKGTKGMRALLDEGRKRRVNHRDAKAEVQSVGKGAERSADGYKNDNREDEGGDGEVDGLMALVGKIKRKSQRV